MRYPKECPVAVHAFHNKIVEIVGPCPSYAMGDVMVWDPQGGWVAGARCDFMKPLNTAARDLIAALRAE